MQLLSWLKDAIKVLLIFLLTLISAAANAECVNNTLLLPFKNYLLLDAAVASSVNDDVTNIILLLLIPIVVAFAFFVFIVYRSRREAIIKKDLAELEMKALRSQMNPHFMFNCLNSIRNFMEANEVGKASDYLVRFSRLMRMVLENSNYKEVSLAKDIASLELYIQLEQMRYSHNFDYDISIDPGIDAENTAVPPLILQPFVENAIIHGLYNRKDKGKLSVTIERHHEYVKYVVADNGSKLKESENVKPGYNVYPKKSLGAGLTKDRIDLLNKSKGLKGYVNMLDTINKNNEYEGYTVEIMLPFEELN